MITWVGLVVQVEDGSIRVQCVCNGSGSGCEGGCIGVW